MENENENINIPLNNIQNSNITENEIFTLDYEDQEIEKNNNFIKWKESMNKKYNGKKNLYKCPYEKHYFYGEIKDYFILCPSCNKKICPFCYRPIVDSWFAICCVKRKVYAMHYQGIEFSNSEKESHFYNSGTEILYFLLPGISFLFLFAIFFNAFFYKIVRKNSNGKNHDLTYEDLLRKRTIKYLIVNMVINGVTSFVWLISFFVFNFGICILLLILLIIRKKWYMYLIGFFHQDWYFLYKNLKSVKICHM